MIKSNPAGPKRHANLAISADLLAQAEMLSIDLASAAEKGIQEAIRQQTDLDWFDRNREAIQSANEYVERHGVPLARFRQF
ncbi:type II toxin-antitoxin system CcdA family antitoxin [Niveispirillum irakense]|uniref:type II toxin-antitoxin system CcdA family antitoxin n=1 Tax=Niveispirillum irakense TaxID=34011 RepID=UPI0003FBFB9D|nr:type II toxin-antitoxin system CcdA family antitoxin [Niveispirillum irakense]